jgi:type II secretory pathway pseudopilin PulG
MKVYKYKSNNGFTYIGLLFVIWLLAMNLTLASTLYSFTQQREKERQLIFIGNQFKQAIAQYYQHTPGTVKRYPRNLDDLLQDNRFVNIERHLRKIYIDPMTEKPEWGLVKAPDGGVMGVYSLSSGKALKTSNFDLGDINLHEQSRYSDWQFVYIDNLN